MTIPGNWRHVPGINNPADLPSRGCSPAELLQSRWWEGPLWLYGPEKEWPVEELNCDESAILKERKQVSSKMKPINCALSTAVLINQELEVDKQWCSVSSSFIKNIRVMVWIRRFVRNVKQQNAQQTSSLTVDELNQSESLLLKTVQLEELN